ncbi:MAG: SDR family oxidoreductase [Chloroflexi bacterium]|nr:SDR family oxidoreductase [Chloroflexota bacterium]
MKIIGANLMPEPAKVLITGASGLLGANLVRHYAPKTETTGWYAKNPITIACAEIEKNDITDQQAVSQALERIQPDLIVHCAAATNVEWCEQNPDAAKAINETATEFLAEKAKELSAKFVFTSTDSVFDGNSSKYAEFDPPKPLNSYASGKVRTEKLVTGVDPNALIIRSYFYGYSPAGTRSLLEWGLVRAQAGKEVPGFTDSYFSPISVDDFADALDAAITNNITGLLHLGSSDRISKYDFAKIVMEIYDCDMSLLKPITVDDVGLKADRPRDTSLSIALLESIWWKSVPSVADGISRIAASPNPFR